MPRFFKKVNINHFFVLILIIFVSYYLFNLLYGDVLKKDTTETTDYDEVPPQPPAPPHPPKKRTDISESIPEVPLSIIKGPVNEKADLSRNK